MSDQRFTIRFGIIGPERNRSIALAAIEKMRPHLAPITAIDLNKFGRTPGSGIAGSAESFEAPNPRIFEHVLSLTTKTPMEMRDGDRAFHVHPRDGMLATTPILLVPTAPISQEKPAAVDLYFIETVNEIRRLRPRAPVGVLYEPVTERLGLSLRTTYRVFDSVSSVHDAGMIPSSTGGVLRIPGGSRSDARTPIAIVLRCDDSLANQIRLAASILEIPGAEDVFEFVLLADLRIDRFKSLLPEIEPFVLKNGRVSSVGLW